MNTAIFTMARNESKFLPIWTKYLTAEERQRKGKRKVKVKKLHC